MVALNNQHNGAERFVKALLAEIRASDGISELTYDADTYALSQRGKVVLRLGSPYRRYCDLPAEFRAGYLTHVAGVLREIQIQIPRNFEDARPNLAIAVTSRCEYEMSHLRAALQSPSPEKYGHVLLAEHVAASPVFNTRHITRPLSAQQFEEWGVSADDVYVAAAQNLDAASQEPFEHIAPGVYRSPWRDTTDCSRLALNTIFHRLDLRGSPVAIAPNINTVLVAGANDPAGLATMAALADGEFNGPYAISGIPLLLEDGAWEGFQVPSGHPAFPDFNRLRARTLKREYASQGQVLQRMFAQQERM